MNTSFSIFDLLRYIIPGSVLVFVLSLFLYSLGILNEGGESLKFITTYSALSIPAFFILSYLFGHFIDSMMRFLFARFEKEIAPEFLKGKNGTDNLYDELLKAFTTIYFPHIEDKSKQESEFKEHSYNLFIVYAYGNRIEPEIEKVDNIRVLNRSFFGISVAGIVLGIVALIFHLSCLNYCSNYGETELLNKLYVRIFWIICSIVVCGIFSFSFFRSVMQWKKWFLNNIYLSFYNWYCTEYKTKSNGNTK